MLRSSLGFHTLTLSKWLFQGKEDQLIEDFRKYSKETHDIQIYKDDYKNTVIKFHKQFKGIEWLIRPDIWYEPARTCFTIVEAKINPKILSGIHSYITAATYDDMSAAITTFDSISKSISPLLGAFADYELKRIDYCINFSVKELVPGCTAEQIMNLIQRGDIPQSYREFKEYDKTSHRMKSLPGSFYLVNKSVTINCYRKVKELQDRVEKGTMKEDPHFIRTALDEAKDIVRFEVQCKYHNIYIRSRRVKAAGNSNVNLYEDLLSPETCADTISYYFNKVIGWGHWYSLQEAKSQIKFHNFRSQKENRLIDALELVSRYRSLADAKKSLQSDDFNRTLRDLNNLGINPVTIPKRWNIYRIWNLLDMYYSKVSEERMKEKFDEEIILNYKKYRKHSKYLQN